MMKKNLLVVILCAIVPVVLFVALVVAEYPSQLNCDDKKEKKELKWIWQ